MTIISHTHLATTHSTNSQLIDWITLSHQEQSPLTHQRPHFSRSHLLTADSQTSGRGQHGRTWQSPIGNVYLSLYIPTAEFSQTTTSCLSQRLDGRLSLCVGYQLSQLPVIERVNQTRLSEHLAPIGVKWVNDVGFYDKQQFQKLAGILIEPVIAAGAMLGVVVGMGVNIHDAPVLTAQTQEGLNYQAICLQGLTSVALNPHDSYQPLQQAILQAIEQFNGFSDIAQVDQFVQDFRQVDVLLDKDLQVNLPMTDKPPLTGKACGIDRHGSLQICQNDGTIAPVWTGTIQVR